MRIEATADNIFVRPQDETAGPIFIPPVFRRRHATAFRGVVVEAGPDALVNAGDNIVFNKWEDNPIVLNGNKVFTIKPSSIIAVE